MLITTRFFWVRFWIVVILVGAYSDNPHQGFNTHGEHIGFDIGKTQVDGVVEASIKSPPEGLVQVKVEACNDYLLRFVIGFEIAILLVH